MSSGPLPHCRRPTAAPNSKPRSMRLAAHSGKIPLLPDEALRRESPDQT